MIPESVLLDFSFFFFNDTATTEIYTLSLHDALPISSADESLPLTDRLVVAGVSYTYAGSPTPALHDVHRWRGRSEEHTSELQSQSNLVCRLLLEKKK